MKKIEITIPELGKATGTTAWVAEELEKINKTLTQGTTKLGTPALFYEKELQNGKLGRFLFCTVGSETNTQEYHGLDFRNYGQVYDKTLCTWPVETNDYWGLFPYLTPKAEESVRDFISTVTYEWVTELENK